MIYVFLSKAHYLVLGNTEDLLYQEEVDKVLRCNPYNFSPGSWTLIEKLSKEPSTLLLNLIRKKMVAQDTEHFGAIVQKRKGEK